MGKYEELEIYSAALRHFRDNDRKNEARAFVGDRKMRKFGTKSGTRARGQSQIERSPLGAVQMGDEGSNSYTRVLRGRAIMIGITECEKRKISAASVTRLSLESQKYSTSEALG